ncbi:MAG: hypothetical protein QNL48_04710, partial [Alcaligenes aquatilis]
STVPASVRSQSPYRQRSGFETTPAFFGDEIIDTPISCIGLGETNDQLPNNFISLPIRKMAGKVSLILKNLAPK